MKRKGQSLIVKRQKLDDNKWKPLETGFGFEGLLSVEVLEDYTPEDFTQINELKKDAREGIDIEATESNGNTVVNDILEDNPFATDDESTESIEVNDRKELVRDGPIEVDNNKPLYNSAFPGWCSKLPASMKHFTPSDIQKQVFRWYEKNKRTPGQVMIAAQTGSGKSLAFLLPLIHKLNNSKSFSSAIVLAPTRELVNQLFDISVSLTCQFPEFRVIKLQGGMSQEKQDRLLRNAAQFSKIILIASPGRLGDLANSLPLISVDEKNDLNAKIEEIDPLESKLLFKIFHFLDWLALDEYENLRGLDGIDHIGTTLRRIKIITNSDWSSTFYISCSSATPCELDKMKLLDLIPFKPFLCNINIKKNPNIRHFHMDCMTMVQKDLAVYYLHHTYTGKTAIFMNSLDGVRRLSAVLRLLFPNKTIKTVRGDMKMANRMQVLEAFASTKNCILVASDVAARGLDIVDTECVIHYDVPFSQDTYVHRSGRTARYERQGVAITLCLPTELKKFNSMLKKLDIPPSKLIRMEPSICDHLKQRLELSREIEKEEHDKRLLNAQTKEEQGYEEALDIEIVKNADIGSKAELRRKKKQLKELLTVNVDEINRKRGTTVITPSMFKSFTSTKESKSFLTLIK